MVRQRKAYLVGRIVTVRVPDRRRTEPPAEAPEALGGTGAEPRRGHGDGRVASPGGCRALPDRREGCAHPAKGVSHPRYLVATFSVRRSRPCTR
jgi:hypothetical protein